MRHNRRLAPKFAHPEGPEIAVQTMANHFEAIFSGKDLSSTRFSAPLIPDGSPPLSLDTCPIGISTVKEALVRRLTCRKAPGTDHLRTEMLLLLSLHPFNFTGDGRQFQKPSVQHR